MLQYMNQKFNLCESLKTENNKFQNLALKLQAGYRNENSYHTSTHAADVVQNVYFYMKHAGGMDVCNTTSFDLVSLFLSSGAHDVD